MPKIFKQHEVKIRIIFHYTQNAVVDLKKREDLVTYNNMHEKYHIKQMLHCIKQTFCL